MKKETHIAWGFLVVLALAGCGGSVPDGVDVGSAISKPTLIEWNTTFSAVVKVTSQPSSLSNSREPSFEFSASETSATFECQLDDGGFSPCSSPKNYSGLSDRLHSFQVRAVSVSGSKTEAQVVDWTVDATAPTTTVTGPDSALLNSTVTYSFSCSGETSCTFWCRLDTPSSFGSYGLVPCKQGTTSGSWSQTLNEVGTFRFLVYSIDAAGNEEQVAASLSTDVQ